MFPCCAHDPGLLLFTRGDAVAAPAGPELLLQCLAASLAMAYTAGLMMLVL